MSGWLLDGAVAWLRDFARDTLNTIWAMLAATLFEIPDVTGLPQVETLASRSLQIVNVGYVLAITVAGVVLMTHGGLQARYGAAELLPRLPIGLMAANFATPISRWFIETGNALVMALTGQGIASDDSLRQLLRVTTTALTNPVGLFLVTLIVLIIDVLLVMLLLGWIARFAALIAACGLAPLALACHGTPWTDDIARLWWRVMGGLVATVVLQAIVLHVSLTILLDPAANLPHSGQPGPPTDTRGVMNLFVIACLLWITVRIPGLVQQYLLHSHSRPNLAGAIVRLVVVQQLTRGLGRSLGGATRGGGPLRAGGGGPARGPGHGPGTGTGPGGGPGGGPGFGPGRGPGYGPGIGKPARTGGPRTPHRPSPAGMSGTGTSPGPRGGPTTHAPRPVPSSPVTRSTTRPAMGPVATAAAGVPELGVASKPSKASPPPSRSTGRVGRSR